MVAGGSQNGDGEIGPVTVNSGATERRKDTRYREGHDISVRSTKLNSERYKTVYYYSYAVDCTYTRVSERDNDNDDLFCFSTVRELMVRKYYVKLLQLIIIIIHRRPQEIYQGGT